MSSAITKISDISTLVDLYKNSHLHPTSPETPPTLPPSSALNSRISIIQKSITTLGVTSIVNAANTALLGGGGVDGAIHAAAGPALLEECRTLNGCPTGSAKVTSAYDLPSSYVIHAVGPIYARARREGPNHPAELLRSCYRTSLQLAAEKGGSVAFSCLSTGVYGYPSNEAAEIATREVRRFLGDEESGARLERVVFCCFEGKDVKAYYEWLPKIFPPPPSDLYAPPDSSTSTASSAPLESSKAPGKGQPAEPISKDVAIDDWEAIEKPEITSQAQSTDSLNDDGEKIEGADVSNGEGEKIEFGDVNGSEKALGRNEAGKSGLLKDW